MDSDMEESVLPFEKDEDTFPKVKKRSRGAIKIEQKEHDSNHKTNEVPLTGMFVFGEADESDDDDGEDEKLMTPVQREYRKKWKTPAEMLKEQGKTKKRSRQRTSPKVYKNERDESIPRIEPLTGAIADLAPVGLKRRPHSSPLVADPIKRPDRQPYRTPNYATPMDAVKSAGGLKGTIGGVENHGVDAFSGLPIDIEIERTQKGVLPMSDWADRFNRWPQDTPEKHKELFLKRLEQQAWDVYEKRRAETCPTFRLGGYSALYVAIMERPEEIPRTKQAFQTSLGEDYQLHGQPLPDIPELSYEYLKQFLRPPKLAESERMCRMVFQCLARQHASNGMRLAPLMQQCPGQGRSKKKPVADVFMKFGPLREFLLPDELAAFKEKGTLPAQPQYCLMCTIASTNMAWNDSIRPHMRGLDWSTIDIEKVRELWNAEMEKFGEGVNVSQRFQVIVDKPSEFPRSACLNVIQGPRKSCIFYPFPRFCSNAFVWNSKGTEIIWSVQNF